VRLSKKFAAIAITASVALTATAAFAYWTTSGSGSGSATAGSSNGVVTLAASIDTSTHAIYPGGSNPVHFTATNSGATDLYVTSVSLSALSATTPAGVVTTPSSCLASDFSMLQVTEGIRIPANTTTPMALTTDGSLVFANSTLSQDNCKGAGITLNVVSN